MEGEPASIGIYRSDCSQKGELVLFSKCSDTKLETVQHQRTRECTRTRLNRPHQEGVSKSHLNYDSDSLDSR